MRLQATNHESKAREMGGREGHEGSNRSKFIERLALSFLRRKNLISQKPEDFLKRITAKPTVYNAKLSVYKSQHIHKHLYQ